MAPLSDYVNPLSKPGTKDPTDPQSLRTSRRRQWLSGKDVPGKIRAQLYQGLELTPKDLVCWVDVFGFAAALVVSGSTGICFTVIVRTQYNQHGAQTSLKPN